MITDERLTKKDECKIVNWFKLSKILNAEDPCTKPSHEWQYVSMKIWQCFILD